MRRRQVTAPQAEYAAISLAAYWTTQARITRSVVDLTTRALNRFGVPETTADRKAVAARLHPHIERARRQSYVVSARHMRGAAPQLQPAPLRPYPVDAVETTLADVVEQVKKPRVEVRELDTVSRKPRVTVAEHAGARFARHAHQAGRDAVADTAEAAGGSVGWARVLSGAENCGFCVMLASRGPVYRSAYAAQHRGKGQRENSFHDHCDCAVVLVQLGRDWDGRKQFELAEDLWSESTKGYSGKAALNALRRQLARAEREHLTHQELLDALRAE